MSAAESIRTLPLDIAHCTSATCHMRHRCWRQQSIPPDAHRAVYFPFKPDGRGECDGFLKAPETTR